MSPRAQPASFAIRPAGPTDALVIAALHQATSTETWSAKSVIDIVGLPSAIARLAFGGPPEAPSPAGFVLAMLAADQAEIVSIGVVQAWRRRGVGRALVAAAVEAVQRRGAKTLFLEVAADNIAALALYRRAGFRPVGRRTAYYVRPGGERRDALVLQADLTPAPAQPPNRPK